MADEKTIKEKYMMLIPMLTERSKRIWAATEALALGRGGISTVSRATGIHRNTIAKGIGQLESPETLAPDGIRRQGGGRKRSSVIDTTLMEDLERELQQEVNILVYTTNEIHVMENEGIQSIIK